MSDIELPEPDFSLDGGKTPCWYEHSLRAAILADREKRAQAAQPVQEDALNTLCKMLHSGEEVEGDDGLAMLVPMDLWNEAQEAIELLVGEDDDTEFSKPVQVDIERVAEQKFFAQDPREEPVQAEAPTASNERDTWRGGSSYEASLLRNLLARIHGDGGHYLEQHGLDKTVEDADQLVSTWRAALATQQEAQPQAEPFARIEFRRGTPGKENDMPTVVSCNWLPDGVYEVYLAAQAEPAGGDKEDAERWRAFISLPYAVRSEWATNLSLVPGLTGWLDSRASYILSGDCPARGDDGLSESDADLLEQVIGELEDDGETMVSYDDLMWFALRGYLHCKYFEVKPEAQEAIDAARAAQQATGERG